MAEFVLFPASAITLVVWPDLFLSGRTCCFVGTIRGHLFGQPGFDRLFGDDGLNSEDRVDHVVLDVIQKFLEHLVAFSFVHNERVSLAIGLKTDAFAQIVHPGEMLDPKSIDDREHDVPLDRAHGIWTEASFHFRVGCISVGVENVEDLQIAYVFADGTVWNTATQVLATTAPNGAASNIPEQALTDPAVTPGPRDVVNVRGLRISVIARSNPLDIGARGLSAALSSGRMRRRAVEDHPAGPVDTIANGAFDRFRLTTTLVLRNRMLGF